MKTLIFALLAILWISNVAGAAHKDDDDDDDDSDLFDAPPDKDRNRKYFNFINTDGIHAACYYTFCYCGKMPYSGYKSNIHEMSCDTHRISQSDKNIYNCTKTPVCKESVKSFENGLFWKLFPQIKHHEITDESCSFFLSTCYGMLLKDAVTLYNHPDKLSYFLPKILGQNK